ncbi:MAG: transcriptional regulator [Desulfovibrio sp.]|jgi:YHS domain-containing protein|nr:transcriptional regulator [Desulfovibrio sp.]
MTRFLFIAIAIGIIYLLLKGDKKKKVERQRKEEERLKASGDLVQDPVCGAYVDRNGQIRVRQGDEVHHFCSYECRDKFLKRLEGASPVKEDAAESEQNTQNIAGAKADTEE